MEKYIKIEWDDTTLKEEHSDGLLTLELIGILEFAKLRLWEIKTIKEEKQL